VDTCAVVPIKRLK